jgi:hypothetical protein
MYIFQNVTLHIVIFFSEFAVEFAECGTGRHCRREEL